MYQHSLSIRSARHADIALGPTGRRHLSYKEVQKGSIPLGATDAAVGKWIKPRRYERRITRVRILPVVQSSECGVLDARVVWGHVQAGSIPVTPTER